VGVDTLTDPDEKYSPEQMEQFRQPFEQDFAKAMGDALRHDHDFFTEKTDPALIDRIVAKMTAAPPEVGISAFQAMLDFANDAQRPRMTEVQVPLVCINTKRDPQKVAAGQKYTPQFEVVSLPEAGHFLMMEDSKKFNELLDAAIKRIVK
jgi:pimeloyl-ACP methyl ester carboxylesterase